MKPGVRRLTLANEFATPEGCFIIEVSNSPDDRQVCIARGRVEPGVTTQWHRLAGIAERYVILEGSGRVEIGDRPAEDVHPGDVVLIPPMCRQRIANTGTVDLLFLAICTPRFERNRYEALPS